MRKHLPSTILKNLYYDFVNSNLNYAIEVYASASKTKLNSLHLLNNKLLRVTQFKPRLTSTTQLYQAYNTLPLELMYKYKLLTFTHNWFYNKYYLPQCFNNLFILNSTIYKLYILRLEYL